MEPKATVATRSGISTRVDPPHTPQPVRFAKAAPPSRAQLAVLAGHAAPESCDVTISEQLQRHACELGERLQVRQRELDQREAAFQAQTAQLENELRSARLVHQELQHELLERQRSIEQREAELEREAADLLHAETTQLAEADQQSAFASRLNEEAKLTAEQWRRRMAELDRSERHLKSQLNDVAFKHAALERERQTLLDESNRRHARLQAQREEEKKRFETQLVSLKKRQEEVEQKSISVQQLHHDTCQTYRETIELRIATEQVWAELTGQLSSVEVTRRLAEWRKKLMDQFALANTALEKQKAENLALIQRLEKQAQELKQMRDELRDWMSRRQQELIEEADKLLVRERELDREQAQFRHHEREWSEQRANYEQEIRRLRRLSQS